PWPPRLSRSPRMSEARAPLLHLDGVHARDAAAPRGKPRGAISATTALLGAGVHAFLGAPEDGLIALVDVLTGVRVPTRGRVRVVGVDPCTTPSIRARIGALGLDPRLPPAPTVGDAIRLILQARGERVPRIDAVLDPFGLGALHARRPATLSFAEARAVELALALTTPAPLLIVLYEPLADVALPEPARVRLHLRDLAAAGACVIIATSSPTDARHLADQVYVLHQGLVVRKAGAQGDPLTLGEARLRAWVAPAGLRALAAELSRSPAVRAVSWEDTSSTKASVALIELRGESAEACATALIEAALTTGATVDAFAPTAPDLAEVRAATDTLLRLRWSAMRAAAMRTALLPGQAAPPAAAPAPALTPAATPVPALAATPEPAPALPSEPTPSPEPEPRTPPGDLSP
ncbi:MAG: ATP-binding cassette domain-containing protein, partial [Minicystis sp.]